jgi:CheY-like chemotaxis protein
VHNATAAVQILTNLLLNGIEFSPPGTDVTLTVSARDGHVYFKVTDSGPGIPPARARLLFTAPNSTRAGGAGVGLRHSEALAREKGGELSLVQALPSAAFELRWPQANKRKSDSGSYPVESPLKGARVLVLEDDQAVCSLIELGLGTRGAEVLPVSNAQEFEQVLAGRPIVDAALIDLSPISGTISESLARLRQVCPNAPLVLITGSPDGVPADVEAEFAAWVRKPFEVGEVAAALETALGAPDKSD